MANPRPQDVLLRIGGGTLRRLQTLCAAGAGRGVEVPYTFTRATVKRAFRDRDGIARRAAAGNLALDWPSGLVDATGNAIGGPLTEGARTQLVTDPEAFTSWTQANLCAVTAGQTDPFGGTGAALLDSNTPSVSDGRRERIIFTGDDTKCIDVFVRSFSGVPARFGLLHDSSDWRVLVRITWNSGIPSLSVDAGNGTLFPIGSYGNGWYHCSVGIPGVIATQDNDFYLYPDQSAAGSATYFFGANAWNAPFPQSYQAPGEATGVADALTTPFNFGPQSDLTVLVRLGRPYHADAGASTALGVSPGIFSFGAGSAARIGAYFDPAARNIISVIDTATTDATQTTAIPAGNPVICIQYKNLTTGGQTALDVGSGYTAFSSAATGFSAFSSQTLRIGRYDDELYGVLGDMVVARGLFTRAEMLSIA